jgi:DNA-binding Xre family transcriptional regulator
MFMSRSLRVKKEFIEKVKTRAKRHFPRQQDLAEELNLSLSTISNFLNGKSIDHLNFIEICRKLELDSKDIVSFGATDDIDYPKASKLETASRHIQKSYKQQFIYIERPPTESNALAEICSPGGLVRIQAPRLMGKTALAINVMKQTKNYRFVHLNFCGASTENLSTQSLFLKWFCEGVSQNLGYPSKIKDYWDEELNTSKLICTEYFEKYLLANSESPLVICLDEVERLSPYPQVASEFLGLLRAWHEKANISEAWRRLRLVVIYSIDIYIPHNLHESPFNIGLSIQLPELTPGQIYQLSIRYQLDLSHHQIHHLMDLVGGHPYLVTQTFMALTRNPNKNMEDIFTFACTEESIYRSHLRYLWTLIQNSPGLTSILSMVLKAKVLVLLLSTGQKLKR